MPAATSRGSASRSAAAALKARTAGPSAVAAQASVGSWMGTPVAVVTAGEDVTLAVGPSWRVVGGWWPSLASHAQPRRRRSRWVLAIGSDARKGEPLERTRADVLQLVGVDGKGGGGVMGLARDLWVPLAPAARARSTRPWSSAVHRRRSRPSRG